MPYADDLAPFEGAKLLVETAKKRLQTYKSEIAIAAANHTYTVVVQDDRSTGEKVIKLRFAQRLSPRLRVTASEILTTLRNALDHAMVDAKRILAPEAKKVSFPLAGSENEFPNHMANRACKGMPKPFLDFVAEFKPYPGGDDFLWAVSKLAADGKHANLLSVVPISDGSILDTRRMRSIGGPIRFGINRMVHLKNELEFARIGIGGHYDADMIVTLEIVIGKADVVEGQPVLAVLDTFASKVESIVLAIEAETSRLSGEGQSPIPC